MGLSLPHLLIVVVIVLLLFGTGRLPRLMEDMGKGINAFKKGLGGDEKQKQIEDKTDKDA
ncbi:MAG: tatA [Micavibrio sp.]|nr:tatA [Micavibrio sp.]